eukprot:4679507-Amphidinium_carterae.1
MSHWIHLCFLGLTLGTRGWLDRAQMRQDPTHAETCMQCLSVPTDPHQNTMLLACLRNLFGNAL